MWKQHRKVETLKLETGLAESKLGGYYADTEESILLAGLHTGSLFISNLSRSVIVLSSVLSVKPHPTPPPKSPQVEPNSGRINVRPCLLSAGAGAGAGAGARAGVGRDGGGEVPLPPSDPVGQGAVGGGQKRPSRRRIF